MRPALSAKPANPCAIISAFGDTAKEKAESASSLGRIRSKKACWRAVRVSETVRRKIGFSASAGPAALRKLRLSAAQLVRTVGK